jgi:hypothetical protein
MFTPSRVSYFWRRHCPVLLILTIAFLNIFPILWKGVAQGDDLDTHLSYFRAFLQELGLDNLYPRWLSTLNGGQGSPIFLIQYPLPYFFLVIVYGPIHFLTRMDVVSAAPALMAATLFILMAFSGWAAYAWLKSWCSPRAALFGSLVYVFAPYHFGLDAYRRYALGELLAYSLIPVVLLYTRNLMGGRKSRTSFVAVSFLFAALICSHPITAAMLFPVIVVQAALARPAAPVWKRLFSLGLALVAGILLSSFYLFPFAGNYPNVVRHPITDPNYSYDENYLKIPAGNILSTMRRHGVSASSEKVVARALGLLGPDFAQQHRYVGSAAIVSLADDVLMVLAGAFCIFMARRWWRNTDLAVWLAIGVISVYVQTYPSHWIADILPPLKAIQFPWRFSIITCIALAAVAAGCWDHVRTKQSSRFRLAGLAVAVFVLLGFGNLVALGVSSFRRQAIVTGIDADQYRVYTGRQYHAVGDMQAPLSLVQSRLLPAGRPWQVVHDSAAAFVIRTNPADADTVAMNLICFPGWKAMDLKTREPLAMGCDNARGLASIAIPKGATSIKIFFPLKTVDQIGRWVSLIVAICLLFSDRLLRTIRHVHRSTGEMENIAGEAK